MREEGVYYRKEDYVGVGKRVVIDLIDVFVACVVSLVTALLAPIAPIVTWSVVWFCYFVLLKRSRFRTLGYVMTGASIVNFQGQRPSIGALFIRLLFAVFGPLNCLLDLLWIPSDARRQSLRDKFAHTYVVRRGAVPAGAGPIEYAYYTIFGWSFLFSEVAAGK